MSHLDPIQLQQDSCFCTQILFQWKPQYHLPYKLLAASECFLSVTDVRGHPGLFCISPLPNLIIQKIIYFCSRTKVYTHIYPSYIQFAYSPILSQHVCILLCFPSIFTCTFGNITFIRNKTYSYFVLCL